MKPVHILHLEDEPLISFITLTAIGSNINEKLTPQVVQVATLEAFRRAFEIGNFDHYILDGRFPDKEIDRPELNVSRAIDVIRETKGAKAFIYIFSGESDTTLLNHLGERTVDGIFKKSDIVGLMKLLNRNGIGS